MTPATETSREDTTWVKAAHLRQQPLFDGEVGTRRWVHRTLQLRVAESTKDRHEVADIVRHRHYLARWFAPPRTLTLSYLGTLGGEGAACAVVVALLPCNLGGLAQALDVHPCSILTLARSWRADDCGPDVAPDLMCETLRRVVKRLGPDWEQRKCQRLRAKPKLLVTYADPGVRHDGGVYKGAGAVALGGESKLLFAWALDSTLKLPLHQYAQARADRAADLRRRCRSDLYDSEN